MNIVRMAQQSDDFESTVWLGTGQSSIRCGKQLEHQAAQCSRCCWDWSMSHCDIKCCCRCGLSCSDFGDNPSNGFLGDFGTLVVVRGHSFVKKNPVHNRKQSHKHNAYIAYAAWPYICCWIGVAFYTNHRSEPSPNWIPIKTRHLPGKFPLILIKAQYCTSHSLL